MVRACIRHIHGNRTHRFFRFRLLVITVSTICWQLTVFSVRWYSVLTVSSVCRNSILTVSSVCWYSVLTVSSVCWYSELTVSSVCWYSVLTVSSVRSGFFGFGFSHRFFRFRLLVFTVSTICWQLTVSSERWYSVLTVSSICRHFLSSVCFWFGFRHIWSGPITTVCWHSVLTVSSVIVATHLSI